MTDTVGLPAYRHRWRVERFVRWPACVPGCRHLLGQNQAGVTIQVDLAILASPLSGRWTGAKPTNRTGHRRRSPAGSEHVVGETRPAKQATGRTVLAPIRACGCGRAKENRGPKDRQLVTAVGEIDVRRRYWQCRCGQPGGYLADTLLGIDGRYSWVVPQHACRLAVDTSFAAAREHLREMLGVRVSAETIRAVVEGHGRAMARFRSADAATEAAFAATPSEVEFAVDAGKVCTRQDGWKDLKIAVLSKRVAGELATPDEWHEGPCRRLGWCWRSR